MTEARFFSLAVSPVSAEGRWPDDVEVWHAGVPDDPEAWILLARCLNPDEVERARRYVRAADRLRFATARITLRALLGARIGEASAALRFDTGPFGRPTLERHPNRSFNVSHAGPHVLIAMSDTLRVGVDIEAIESTYDLNSLRDLVCSEDERLRIDSVVDVSPVCAFFRCWTAKEALLKALGMGIAEHLHAVSVDPGGSGRQRSRVTHESVAAAGALQFHWIDDFDDFVGCVAFGE